MQLKSNQEKPKKNKFSSSVKVLSISTLSGLVSGARFLFMFYFSTMENGAKDSVADVVFINGNNAVFVSLFSTLVLIPLAQFKNYNKRAIFLFLTFSLIISFIWHLVYDYETWLISLMSFVMFVNILYELARRLLFIVKESYVKAIDVSVSVTYLSILLISVLYSWNIYTYLCITSSTLLLFILFIINRLPKNQFIEVPMFEFFKLNHSGVGQSLLMFISGNYIYQLISFYGNSNVFTKVNIIRIWITPISLLLNGLDFVYSKDKYEGNVPNWVILLTIIFTFLSFRFFDDYTYIYCSAFVLIIPFQFWLRGLQIKLRQFLLHKVIWRLNIAFVFLSILFSTLIVFFVDWAYWSWYLILVYFSLWIIWIFGKRRG